MEGSQTTPKTITITTKNLTTYNTDTVASRTLYLNSIKVQKDSDMEGDPYKSLKD